MDRSRISVLLLLSAAPLAHAAQPAPKVDAELLEFLGSIDGDEEGWQDFLEQMPVKRARPTPPATTPDSSSTTRTPAAASVPPAPKGTPPAAGGQGKAAQQDTAKVTEK